MEDELDYFSFPGSKQRTSSSGSSESTSSSSTLSKDKIKRKTSSSNSLYKAVDRSPGGTNFVKWSPLATMKKPLLRHGSVSGQGALSPVSSVSGSSHGAAAGGLPGSQISGSGTSGFAGGQAVLQGSISGSGSIPTSASMALSPSRGNSTSSNAGSISGAMSSNISGVLNEGSAGNLKKKSRVLYYNEKAYLRKLRTVQPENDYYTRGISAEVSDFSEDEEEEAFCVMDKPDLQDRIRWQTMLNKVLTGDIVKSEKTRLASDENVYTFQNKLWLELRAYSLNRTVEEQWKLIEYSRASADALFDEIMSFCVKDTQNVYEEVSDILDRYYKATELWITWREMYADKPITATPEFQDRISMFCTWKTVYDGISVELEALRKWTGNDALDVDVHNEQFERSTFAETIMKEKNIEQVFQNQIFSRHGPWLLKSKYGWFKYSAIGLPMGVTFLGYMVRPMMFFPFKLLKEIIKVRLDYAEKMENPTMMMIDQMIDDSIVYLRMATSMQNGVSRHLSGFRADPKFKEYDDGSFEEAEFAVYVGKCLRFLFKLLNMKLLSLKTFKETELLEKYWYDLKNVGKAFPEFSIEVCSAFVQLTVKLIYRLNSYMGKELESEMPFNSETELSKWCSNFIEKVGTMRRKLVRFQNTLSKNVYNTAIFESTPSLMDSLAVTEHVLLQSLTEEGIYVFGTPGITEEQVENIVSASELGTDLYIKNRIHNSLALYGDIENYNEEDSMFVLKSDNNGNEYYDLFSPYDDDTDDDAEYEEAERAFHNSPYIVIFCPNVPVVWKGEHRKFSGEYDFPDVLPGQFIVMTTGSSFTMDFILDRFDFPLVEKRCSIHDIQRDLDRIPKGFHKLSSDLITAFPRFKKMIQKQSPALDSIQQMFVFIKDFRKSFVLQMLELSVDWITFIVDECPPTEKKTFRWCVMALEFTMQMSKGNNIQALPDDRFGKLQEKVAGCMSLLISHFDIMGARSRDQAEKLRSMPMSVTADDDSIIKAISDMRMDAIAELESVKEEEKPVGKVLDDADGDTQYLTYLASSFSNISIRWQKTKFIGGGSFGTVFSAVNLDSGSVLAVKEIRFQDSTSVKKLLPSIKEEMTVLELLNHPNVVQYYGVEIHRDRVYIFMEFCEGGSLASLLEHGRIEDEIVIQIYALQMLEGLAYLHQSGIAHRDIKPENILLDHNGVIKFVDFGAAKLIAKSGKTRASMAQPVAEDSKVASMTGTPMYMSPEAITGGVHIGARFGAVDVWSLGCVILEMATGKRPWAALDNEWAIMYHIAAGHVPQFPNPEQISPAGRKFLKRCLIQDPSKRASAMELLMDPWIVSIINEAFGETESSSATSSM